MTKRVHVIDGTVKRRAEISSSLTSSGISNEIYEGLDEFLECAPSTGLVLARDEENGPDCSRIINSLSTCGNYLPVAMYADTPSPERIVDAMLSGAIDYLAWPIGPSSIEGVFAKLNGQAALRLARERSAAAAIKQVEVLSQRESQVLKRLVQGRSNRLIGEELGISVRTVEIHRANMMNKLNARSVSEAVRIAIYAGVDD